MDIIDFGISDYRDIWEEQKKYRQHVIDSKKQGAAVIPEYLMIGEHYPVYTLGVHGNSANLLLQEDKLKKENIECIRIERGGDITYHGPGQIVVYPIIDLCQHSLGVKKYIHLLEESVLRVLTHFNIKAERVDGAPGIWIDSDSFSFRKICAVGVKISRGITMHGVSLNVNMDLTPFSYINPCGFVDKGVTSIAKETNKDVSLQEVKKRLIDSFNNLFSC